ncbi:MAG TPA: hypothetical protein VFT98_20405, partial [Myxococcota bacterium]|nr:hypothetical protein [Myxococcota bacterium]
MFSARASWDLTPSALARRVDAARASGRPLFDLTHANPASLALSGELLAVSAPWEDGAANDAGAVYVYRRDLI